LWIEERGDRAVGAGHTRDSHRVDHAVGAGHTRDSHRVDRAVGAGHTRDSHRRDRACEALLQDINVLFLRRQYRVKQVVTDVVLVRRSDERRHYLRIAGSKFFSFIGKTT